MTRIGRYVFVRHRHNWDLLARFSLVGATGVVVNLLVFGCLLDTGVDSHGVVAPILATPFNVRWYHVFSTVAFLTANLWNFQLNRRWAFKSVGRAAWHREYGPFLLVGLLGQLLGLVVLTLLLHPHSPLRLPASVLDGSSLVRNRELWGQAMTIAVVTPVSFVGNKLWTFQAVRGVRPASRTGDREGHVPGPTFGGGDGRAAASGAVRRDAPNA